MTTATLTHPPLDTLDLQIEGMTCASCSSRVEKALSKVPGVVSAEVNLATERAEVQFESPATTKALIAAVQAAGYTASKPSPSGTSTAAGSPWWPIAVAAALSLPLALPMLGLLFGATGC